GVQTCALPIFHHVQYSCHLHPTPFLGLQWWGYLPLPHFHHYLVLYFLPRRFSCSSNLLMLSVTPKVQSEDLFSFFLLLYFQSIFGSNASLKASPKKLNDKTNKIIASPG